MFVSLKTLFNTGSYPYTIRNGTCWERNQSEREAGVLLNVDVVFIKQRSLTFVALIFVYGMDLDIGRFAFLCLLTHNVAGRRMDFVACGRCVE
jgi:hypothetical protein